MRASSKILLEQVLSSISSGLLLLALVAITAPSAFGAVSLVYIISQMALTILRMAVLAPLHTKDAVLGASRERLKINLLVSGGTGVGVGLFAVVVTTLLLREMPIEAVLVAVCTPLIFVNEALRQTALANGKFAAVVPATGVWAAASLGILLLRFVGFAAPAALIVMWAVGAGASIAILLARRVGIAALTPSADEPPAAVEGMMAMGALTNHLPSRAYLAFGTLLPVSVLIFQLCVASSAGSMTFGELAANTLAWTPVSVAMAGIPVLLGRRYRNAPARLWREVGEGVAFAVIPALVWGGVLAALAQGLLSFLLGSSSSVVEALIPVSVAVVSLLSFQLFLFSRFLIRGSDTYATWFSVIAVVVRAALGLALLLHPDLSAGSYLAVEAIGHGLLAFVILAMSITTTARGGERRRA